jgi:hypothetical protein
MVPAIDDPAPGGAWPGKLLTKNQMFGERTDDRSEPATENRPDLHQLVHQRLWMTMDALGREPKDQVRPRTNCRYWRGAACDYGSEGFICYRRPWSPRMVPGSGAMRVVFGCLSKLLEFLQGT